MSEQTFVQQLVQESLPVWEQCLHSKFLERLADGTLDEACFKGYIVEDSLYLREYAKVFAWGMTKAKDMQTIRTYYSLLSFVNESEDAARLHYLTFPAACNLEKNSRSLFWQNDSYRNSGSYSGISILRNFHGSDPFCYLLGRCGSSGSANRTRSLAGGISEL